MDKNTNYPNKSEQRVGDALRKLGIDVLYQHKVGPYSLDIFLPDYNVCIEVYGPHHVERKRLKTDLTRQNFLENMGIKVYIITAQEAHVAHDVKMLINKVIRENTTNIGTKSSEQAAFNNMKDQIDEWLKRNTLPNDNETIGDLKTATKAAESFESLLDKYFPAKPNKPRK